MNRVELAENRLDSLEQASRTTDARLAMIEKVITGQPMQDSKEKESAELQERIDAAIDLIMNRGCYDGSHHKQYALDQALRILAGERYDEIVRDWENGEDGPRTYEWKTGQPA